MKTILYILIFNLSAISFAQDPRIFNTTWYLQNLIFEGQDNFPPSNSEVPYVGLWINNPEMQLETGVCNMGFGPVEFDNSNSSFIFPFGISITLGSCNNSLNTAFESKYLNGFFGWLNISDPYYYDITDDGTGDLTLVITSENGPQAIYGNQMLSTTSFDDPEFTIHPNPTSGQITLTSRYGNEAVAIKIFDSTGKMLKSELLTAERNHTVDISNHSSGIYFLKIHTENGNVTAKRIIKE